jgi:hypothetical protein
MEPALTIAVISAAASAVGIGVSTWSARSAIRLQDELARGAEAHSQEQQRKEKLEALVSRYRDPLLLAAVDLQSRLYNIIRQDFLAYLHDAVVDSTHGDGYDSDGADRDYVRDNTVFVLAQFFGWVEALRVDVQFLDLGDVEQSRDLRLRLDAVRTVLADDQLPDQRLRLFWGQQRAIGELMLLPRAADPAGNSARECLGYARFVDRLHTDRAFASWFARLGTDLDSIAHDPTADWTRLTLMQHALIGLIDFLDQEQIRVPADRRTRV